MKKTAIISTLFAFMMVFSGCGISTSLSTPADPMAVATVVKTTDAGTTWQPKIKIDDKSDISGINVLSMAIDPRDSNIVYLGAESGGIFQTKNGGETWVRVPFADKVYGLAIDHQNHENVYASGVYNKRAKIYKRTGEGQEWKELYSEPSNGTIITSLSISPLNSQIIYAGTDAGVIIKSTNGGQTWMNLKKLDGPVVSIAIDRQNDYYVYFAVFLQSVFETKDGGTNIEKVEPNSDSSEFSLSAVTVAADPAKSGSFYIGTNSGMTKCSSNNTCSAMNVIASSKPFPIRAIVVNPSNPQEIFYSSAKAIYKSTDGGQRWSTFQLDTNKEISVMSYDPNDSTKIYAGLRKF